MKPTFLRLSRKTLNLNQINWIDWQYWEKPGQEFIRIMYGGEDLYLLIPSDSDDAGVLRDYFKLISIEHVVRTPIRGEG